MYGFCHSPKVETLSALYKEHFLLFWTWLFAVDKSTPIQWCVYLSFGLLNILWCKFKLFSFFQEMFIMVMVCLFYDRLNPNFLYHWNLTKYMWSMLMKNAFCKIQYLFSVKLPFVSTVFSVSQYFFRLEIMVFALNNLHWVYLRSWFKKNGFAFMV